MIHHSPIPQTIKNSSSKQRSSAAASPNKIQITGQLIHEKLENLTSDIEENQADAINFFANNTSLLNVEIIKTIFEVGASSDEEMNLVICETFLPSLINDDNFDLNLLQEAEIFSYLTGFFTGEDTYMFTQALDILQKICNKSSFFKQQVLESSICEDSLELAFQKVNELSETTLKEDEQEFIDSVYLIEGSFHLANIFLPTYSQNTGELINSLLRSNKRTLISLGFDCLHIWLQKCELEQITTVLNPEFGHLFHQYLNSTQDEALLGALFVVDDSLKRTIETADYFIANGLGDFIVQYDKLDSRELCLLLSILCQMSEGESEMINQLLGSEKVEELMNFACENEQYTIYQYTFIFIIHLCEKETTEIYQYVFEKYSNILQKMIGVLDSGNNPIGCGVLKCFYRLFSWILSMNQATRQSYFDILNPSQISDAIDGLLEMDISPEIEELANSLRDALE